MTHKPLKPREFVFVLRDRPNTLDQLAWKDDNEVFVWNYYVTTQDCVIMPKHFNEESFWKMIERNFSPENIHRFYMEVES